MAAKMVTSWELLRASCLLSSQWAPGNLTHQKGAGSSRGFQVNAGRAQEFQGEKPQAFILPRALSWCREKKSTLPAMWAEYFACLEGTLGHLATPTGIHTWLWHLEGEQDFCWCLGARGEGTRGHRLYPLAPQSA